jgi:hypothetical protein
MSEQRPLSVQLCPLDQEDRQVVVAFRGDHVHDTEALPRRSLRDHVTRLEVGTRNLTLPRLSPSMVTRVEHDAGDYR